MRDGDAIWFEENVHLLEVAVGNVVVAPVWDCIELQAVGEFHLVDLAKLLKLLPSLLCPLLFSPGPSRAIRTT